MNTQYQKSNLITKIIQAISANPNSFCNYFSQNQRCVPFFLVSSVFLCLALNTNVQTATVKRIAATSSQTTGASVLFRGANILSIKLLGCEYQPPTSNNGKNYE